MHNELKIGTKCKNLKSVFTAHFFGNVFSLCRPTQGYQKIFPTRYFLPLRKTVHCPKMTFFSEFQLIVLRQEYNDQTSADLMINDSVLL